MTPRSIRCSDPRTTPTPNDAAPWRRLYTLALDPEGDALAEPLVVALRADMSAEWAPPDLDAARSAARAWTSEATDAHRRLATRCVDDATRAVLTRRAALSCAPLCLLSGAWLQWLSSPANAEDGTALRLLARYADDLGAGQPHASRGHAYRQLLSALRLSERATPLTKLAADPHIDPGAFRLPAALLAASRHPVRFLPELIGADACLRTVGWPPAMELVRTVRPDTGRWRRLDLSGGADEAHAVALDWLQDAGEAGRARMLTGFGWALSALGAHDRQLYTELDAARDPGYEMIELLRLRSPEAVPYHQEYRLHGRRLADWLADCATDPGPLLTALADSPLVRPGRSTDSPLATSLLDRRGPMFRVFTPDEQQVIRRWIDALPVGGPARAAVPQAPRNAAPAVAAALDAAPEPGAPPADHRVAYSRLLSRVHPPALRRYAMCYARTWLAACAREVRDDELLPPRSWDAGALRHWLTAEHDRHIREFEALDEGVPSRTELIDGALQQAPLTLIDGSWLRGFTDYHHAVGQSGYALFHTYFDELGNGDPRLNHPLIYRELLDEMGVQLPPTASPAFAAWPGFRDSSFHLPVYWLCVGTFPRSLLPELLGLNLAMELSGVGGGYRQARRGLRAHGFSTRFVDIHNTIDNVATGHAAWAVDAIVAHLEQVERLHGTTALEQVWQRVRTGYRSLRPPSDWRPGRVLGRRRQRRR